MVCVFLRVVGNFGVSLQEEGRCFFFFREQGEEGGTEKQVKTLKPGGSCEEMLGYGCFQFDSSMT